MWKMEDLNCQLLSRGQTQDRYDETVHCGRSRCYPPHFWENSWRYKHANITLVYPAIDLPNQQIWCH